jgi:hypothetical protein
MRKFKILGFLFLGSKNAINFRFSFLTTYLWKRLKNAIIRGVYGTSFLFKFSGFNLLAYTHYCIAFFSFLSNLIEEKKSIKIGKIKKGGIVRGFFIAFYRVSII